MMTKAEVSNAVYNAVQFINSESGGGVTILTGGTKPLGGVSGFDSINGAEVCTMLEASLGCAIPPSAKIFGSTVQPSTMDEIVNRVCTIMGVEGD